MNGYYMYKALSEDEQLVCFALWLEFFGLTEEQITQREDIFTLQTVSQLVADGVVESKTLLDSARNFIELRKDWYEEAVEDGGFLALRERSREQDVFRAYDMAVEIVDQGETEENLKLHYQLIQTLYDYVDLIY